MVLNLSINDILYSYRLEQEFQSLLYPLHSSHQNTVSVISINEGSAVHVTLPRLYALLHAWLKVGSIIYMEDHVR